MNNVTFILEKKPHKLFGQTNTKKCAQGNPAKLGSNPCNVFRIHDMHHCVKHFISF